MVVGYGMQHRLYSRPCPRVRASEVELPRRVELGTRRDLGSIRGHRLGHEGQRGRRRERHL